MTRKYKGTLIVIGGHESKKGEMAILREVAAKVGKGKLCIATVASKVGDTLWDEYRSVFHKLGVRQISHLDVYHRNVTVDEVALKAVRGSKGIFFTGGDQLKITSELGGTRVAQEIKRIFRNGGMIAGTSAGASVMSETMLISGVGASSYRIGSGLRMAPGLGLLKGITVDQHFAERGRIGRLIGSVAHNPKFLGVGLDEDTAIVVEKECFRVIGSGAVYVVDAAESSGSNISDAEQDTALSLFNIRLHLLSSGDIFDLKHRRPVIGKKR